jgi:predicted DNA binding CopG/RHH family protein
MPKKKVLPRFKNEDAEREFWAKADALDYFDPKSARPGLFPNLKPSNKTISLRLPAGLLDHLKSIANRQDVPYQSLVKVFLAERVKQELGIRAR